MIRIRYKLSLPKNAERENAVQLLQQFCLDQPFEQVSDLKDMGFIAKLGLPPSKPFEVHLTKSLEFEGVCWPGYKLREDEFLHRYLAVIRTLDRAKELGFIVDVKDGGGYWKNRDLKRLLAAKKLMDSLPDPQVLFGATSDNMSIGNFNKKLETN